MNREAIGKLHGNVAVIVLDHDTAVTKGADQIIEMNAGKASPVQYMVPTA